MKILQILEATVGGTARHSADLCIGLRRAGHEVHFIYNPRPDRVDDIFRRALPELEAAGVRLVPLEMSRAPGPRDLRALLAIRRYIRRHGPFDVIHGHSSKGGAYARAGGFGFPGLRVYTPHAFVTADPGLAALPRIVYSAVERMLAPLGHCIIAVSDEERREAMKLGVRAEKIVVVPNGADVVACEHLTRAALGLPEDRIIIGTVGRLVAQKAPLNLLRAFAALPASAHLAIVGSGPLEAAAKGEAERLGIADRVHWLGPRDGPSVMPLYDIFALASDYEGLPYVLIEALHFGLPIAATAVGGASTVVDDGVNGFIVPVGRPERLAEALGRLVADPGLRERMAKASLERRSKFSAAAMVARVIETYERFRTGDVSSGDRP